MNFEEFQQWLRQLVSEGRLQLDEYEDLLEQRRLFDDKRSIIERDHPGTVVGFVRGHKIVAATAQDLLSEADTYGGQIYYEDISPRHQVRLYQ